VWLSLDLNALAQPNTSASEDRNVGAEAQLLEQQKVFVETTQTIKGSLQALMQEVEYLERKLTLKKFVPK
jgi:hypothetical protein